MRHHVFLNEGRVDDFKTKFARKFSSEQIDKIVNSIAPKYLDWVGRNYDATNFNETFEGLVNSLGKFDKISTNLAATDINSYKSLSELSKALQDYKNRPKRDYKKVEGGTVVFDDGKYFVVNPQTHKSSCYYGKGTKWCTAAESETHFKRFNEDGKLFYILDRTLDSSDPYYKIALLYKFDGDKSFWDAKDDRTMLVAAQMGKKKYEEIMNTIETYMNSEYAEQIKHYVEVNAKRIERERLERVRQLQILNQRREEAQERRSNDEWKLDSDCPDEGRKAHALLDMLVYNGDVQVRTEQETQELVNLKEMLEQLQEKEIEIENNGEDTTEIESEISSIEEMIEELESKIDVYNLIPDGSYYEMTEFEAIDASGLENRRYAVGDERETRDSAIDSVKGLLDDIGFEGFNRHFVMRFIDRDKVADYAEDFYRDDIYQNPEVYLNEEDRILSSEQEDKINVLNHRIETTKNQIDYLEKLKVTGDKNIPKKIEELDDLIYEYESEIDDIKSDPQGDFPDELIEEKLEDLADEAKRNPEWFISEFDLDWKDFINEDKFVEAVVDEDGYGHTLNRYDGSSDEYKVLGTWYYVMRID